MFFTGTYLSCDLPHFMRQACLHMFQHSDIVVLVLWLRASGTMNDGSRTITWCSVMAQRLHWHCGSILQAVCCKMKKWKMEQAKQGFPLQCPIDLWAFSQCLCTCYAINTSARTRVCGCAPVGMFSVNIEACCVCHCICDFDSLFDQPGAVVTCWVLLSALCRSHNSTEIQGSACWHCGWLLMFLHLYFPRRADCPLLSAEKG